MGNSSSKPSAQDEYVFDLSRNSRIVKIACSQFCRAILNLKIQRDRLHKYQKRITIITSREHEIAKTLLAQGDRQRALLALRRKKYQESLLAKTDAQLEQLEQLTSSVEFALVQKDVVFGLQEGTRVLKEIQKEMGGLEQVEKLMGETADAIAYQQVCVGADDDGEQYD
jgi:charged multivesicular body protein 6